MDGDLWCIVVESVNAALAAIKPHGRRPRFSDRLIVLMLIWAAWHDRCLSWACDRAHYHNLFRPRSLPSISQFCRRVKTDRIGQVLLRVHQDLSTRGIATPFDGLTYLDGKSLLTGSFSKDPDARSGKSCGAFGKGYKLHALVNERRRIVIWCVMPLNVDEKVVAQHLLLPQMPQGNGQNDSPADIAFSAPLTLADSNYDSAPLHKAFTKRGLHLLSPLRGEQKVGPQGRSKKQLQAMGPARREVVAVWKDHPSLANYVLIERITIEGVFSVASLCWDWIVCLALFADCPECSGGLAAS